MENVTAENRALIESFCEAARANPEVHELWGEHLPALLDQMQQAHDCLGLIIAAYQKGSGVSGVVNHGYCLQFDMHIKAAGALEKELIAETIKILQKEHQ